MQKSEETDSTCAIDGHLRPSYNPDRWGTLTRTRKMMHGQAKRPGRVQLFDQCLLPVRTYSLEQLLCFFAFAHPSLLPVLREYLGPFEQRHASPLMWLPEPQLQQRASSEYLQLTRLRVLGGLHCWLCAGQLSLCSPGPE